MNVQRIRNYSFVVSIVLLLIFLGSVTEIVFKFEEYFNIGYFSTEKNYRTTYSDGYGEVNTALELERIRDDTYSYRILLRFSSGSSVEVVGLKQINYSITLAASSLTSLLMDFDPPTIQFSRTSAARIDTNNLMVWRGTAEVQYISQSLVQNETIQFVLRVKMSMSQEDYYNIGLISYVTLFLWVMAFPIGPIILKAVFQPNFRGVFDEETQKKQRKYLDYFKKDENEQK
ncbi:MAG: hypothetical protein ACFE96_02675 [Candidatus Hermodarchaeota archaeon]